MSLVVKVLRNGLHRYALPACRNGLHRSYKCDVTRVQRAAEWIASGHTAHMLKRDVTRVQKVLRNGLHRTHYSHVRTCDVTQVQSATEWTASVHTAHMSNCAHVNTCDVTRVQSATEWIASVHAAYRSKRAMQRVVKVRRNELHGYNMHRARGHCLGGFLDRGFRIIV